MTDRRTHRRINKADADEQKGQQENSNEPSKQQYEVAKYLRWQCPTKQTPMEGRGLVVYFTASKAVDALLNSKWATKKGDREPLFVSRETVTRYLDELLRRDFFHRARKITVKKIGGRADDNDAAGSSASGKQQISETESSPRTSPRAKSSSKKALPSLSSKSSPEQQVQAADESIANRRKKKIKLEYHTVQRFVDGKEAYVWLYEPTSISQIVYGSLIVVGAIGLCLFPLWPPIVRQGVYYLALTAASLIGFLFFLAGFRYVPFAIGWALTAGKLHFWLLPNLTQDVGFLESFIPVYECEWQTKDGKLAAAADKDDKKKKKKADKAKKSDDEDDDDDQEEQKEEHDADAGGKSGDDDKIVDKHATNDADDADADEEDIGAGSNVDAAELQNDNDENDDNERHVMTKSADQETLRGRSASPTHQSSLPQKRSPSPAPKSSSSPTSSTRSENAVDSVNSADMSPLLSAKRVTTSGSSQDSSTSQEDFEMIERDDRLNAAS